MTSLNSSKASLLPLIVLSASALFGSAVALGADHANDAQSQARALLDRPIAHSTLQDGVQARREVHSVDPQNQAQQLLVGHTNAYDSKRVPTESTLVARSLDGRHEASYPDAQESARRLLAGQSEHSSHGGNRKLGTSSVSRAKTH
jgi:hypothetical protein